MAISTVKTTRTMIVYSLVGLNFKINKPKTKTKKQKTHTHVHKKDKGFNQLFTSTWQYTVLAMFDNLHGDFFSSFSMCVKIVVST